VGRIDSQTEIEFLIEQAGYEAQEAKCFNNAPVLAIRKETSWFLIQGCCNSWTCPRCGKIRAKQEYARMIEGSRILEARGEKLYFMTLTCRGRELELDKANREYLAWTNRLLSTLRADSKKHGMAWFYVQVTEKQERGHPHSHILITYCPTDAREYKAGQFMPGGRRAKHGALYSAYLIERAYAAGLGRQTDLTSVRSGEAVTRYIAKYLFKKAVLTEWEKGWRRIRYSRNFPKLPEKEGEGFPVLHHADWMRVSELENVYTRDETVLELAYAHLVTNVGLLDTNHQNAI